MKSKFYKRFAMVFTTMALFTYIAIAQTTISVQVIDVNDDAEEFASDVGGSTVGDLDLASSDLELVFDHEPQFVGMIFRDVQIPAGSTVTNAYVQFEVDAIVPGTTDAAINLEVYGAKEANVTAPFAGTPFEISSHPKTTATVAWSPGPSVAVDDHGVNEQTPDISAIIQEIIGLAGWASGNNVLIVVTGDAGQTEDINREMESFDGEATAAPILNVTYTAGTGVENQIASEFSNLIYPNPAAGKLYINNPSTDKFSYEIYSITGKLVASRHNITGSTTEVDLSHFAKGAYFVNVRSTEKTKTHKLIVK